VFITALVEEVYLMTIQLLWGIFMEEDGACRKKCLLDVKLFVFNVA